MSSSRKEASLEGVVSSVYVVPTDEKEADGTLAWDKTTMVLVEAHGGGESGIGYSYTTGAAKKVVDDVLAEAVIGVSALDVPEALEKMVRAARNFGRPGVVSSALSAVETALFDLKARLLGLPLASLFGRAMPTAPIYGSGGFTTYDDATTTAQLEKWVGQWQVARVKIKIGESFGTNAERDLDRVALARSVIGPEVELYVDANGGYQRKQAVRLGREFADRHGVSWFEEPVSSDDLEGLREVRDQLDVDVAAGEYGYDAAYFSRMISAGAVDCIQADVTRCGGYLEWLRVAALAAARSLQISGHCAPNLHAHVAVAVPNLRHLEYFHDHHRIETLFFDGALSPVGGSLSPDLGRPGNGLELKRSDAEAYRLA